VIWDLGADDSIGAANATLALLLTRRQKCPANGEDEASVSSLSFVLPQMNAKRRPDSHTHPLQLTCSFSSWPLPRNELRDLAEMMRLQPPGSGAPFLPKVRPTIE
jgi:hypothetical protein